MEFALKVRLGNAAMQDGEEVAELLRRLADRLESSGWDGDIIGTVRDANGNTVGGWELS